MPSRISSLGTRTIRVVRRTGPNPAILGRLVVHRVDTQVRQRRLRTRYPELVAVAGTPRLKLPAIGLPPAAQWPPELAGALAQLRAEADAACAHTVDLLGSGPTQLGAEIDWHRDFKSGFRWPQTFYQDVVVTRLDDDSDAKVPWELSRCHQLVALGRAAAIFGDEAYVTELERQLRAWIEANPPGAGINWTNAMEVAIRAVNWIWALAALANVAPIAPDLAALAGQSLAAHGRHIWHNLEGSPELRSNHYLSDIVGLAVIAVTLPEDPMAGRWRDAAARALEHEARSQILPDGLDFEASLSYHGLVMELLLIACWTAREAGSPLSQAFEATLGRMLDASLALRHPDGRIPQFGDCDSGRVLPATWRRPATHDHLIWTGAAMLGGAVPDGPMPDAEVAFTLGLDAWRRAVDADRCVTPTTSARTFADAGLHVLRGGGAHLVVRCGDVGQNGNGGHSHNDLLSYELSLDGALVVADPGTYAYTSDPVARNRFRATAAHSTLLVGGEEIAPIDAGELFRLPRFAHPLAPELALTPAAIRLVCAHDGYRRLEPPVIARRTFTLDTESGELTVGDELTPGDARPHAVRSHIQLAPGWTAEAAGDRVLRLAAGATVLWIEVIGDVAVTVGEGWVSPRFGIREPAPCVRIDAPAGGRGPLGYRIARRAPEPGRAAAEGAS